MNTNEALKAAGELVGVVYMGRGQYALQYPWKGMEGPRTTSRGTYSYNCAAQRRAAMVAQYAYEMIKPEGDSDLAIEIATYGGIHYGPARDILRRALKVS